MATGPASHCSGPGRAALRCDGRSARRGGRRRADRLGERDGGHLAPHRRRRHHLELRDRRRRRAARFPLARRVRRSPRDRAERRVSGPHVPHRGRRRELERGVPERRSGRERPGTSCPARKRSRARVPSPPATRRSPYEETSSGSRPAARSPACSDPPTAGAPGLPPARPLRAAPPREECSRSSSRPTAAGRWSGAIIRRQARQAPSRPPRTAASPGRPETRRRAIARRSSSSAPPGWSRRAPRGPTRPRSAAAGAPSAPG